MLQATKAETFSVTMAWRGEGALPLAADPASLETETHVRTTAQRSENARLGFGRKNPAQHQGSKFVNSTSALGIEPVFVSEGVRSSSSGRENDGTGVYFYRSRYYSPSLQRFVSEDPIGTAGGINLYAYVGNDPILLTDPTGRCPMCIAGIIGGVIGGAAAGIQAYANGASALDMAAAV